MTCGDDLFFAKVAWEAACCVLDRLLSAIGPLVGSWGRHGLWSATAVFVPCTALGQQACWVFVVGRGCCCAGCVCHKHRVLQALKREASCWLFGLTGQGRADTAGPGCFDFLTNTWLTCSLGCVGLCLVG